MAFERYPYTNFHDLNLDWIIQQVTEWAKEWAVVYEEYQHFKTDLTQIQHDIDELFTKTSENSRQINSLLTSVSNLQYRLNTITARLITLEALVQTGLTDLNDRVTVLEESQAMYMFSPFTGLYVPLTTVIYELAQYHLADALTAAEYDALDMTAAYYDAKDLTAIQYDNSGKILLP